MPHTRRAFAPWLTALLALGAALLPAYTATEEAEKVWVMQVDHKVAIPPAQSHLAKYELAKFQMALDDDHPLLDVANELGDDSEGSENEVLADAGCFAPTMKLVFRDRTYVLSTFCTSARRFANSAPYVTSAAQEASDFVFTEDMLEYLQMLHRQRFKPDYTLIYKQLASRVKKGEHPVAVEQDFTLEDLAEMVKQAADITDEEENADAGDDAEAEREGEDNAEKAAPLPTTVNPEAENEDEEDMERVESDDEHDIATDTTQAPKPAPRPAPGGAGKPATGGGTSRPAPRAGARPNGR